MRILSSVMRVSEKYLIPIAILLLVSVDQISKYFVQSKLEIGETAFMLTGGFGITYVINDGSGSGSFLAWKGIRPLVVVALILVLFFVCFGYRYYVHNYRESRYIKSALIFMVGAGIGNLIDHAVLGYVRDFLAWPGPGTPNLADIFAFLGVSLLLIELIKNPKIINRSLFCMKPIREELKDIRAFFVFVRKDIANLFLERKGAGSKSEEEPVGDIHNDNGEIGREDNKT